ncbi:MAG TPA: aminoglycoside phosphotransferase family protein, partial [Clostridia bacterium]|nr:aminoglycoside phosphotransferase family protein [Clostridia bacterium]
MDLYEIANNFKIQGSPAVVKPYGAGHINDTYYVQTDQCRKYILQKINQNVFGDIGALMLNIKKVTDYLTVKSKGLYRSLTIVPTIKGALYHESTHGCYRMYDYVDNGITYKAASPEIMFRAGSALGEFVRLLDGFPADCLTEVIPAFHNTKARLADLERAVKHDRLMRADCVKGEIAFAYERKVDSGLIVDMLDNRTLPLRVAHNDTKLDNIIFDRLSGKPICIADLDTVMPGSVLYDFGDAIRSAANPAAEDETDLDKVYCDLRHFERFAEGFLAQCGDILTADEIEFLHVAPRILALECGIRFLTDYLDGDRYFKTHREHQNLDRCRAQFKLVYDMENKHDEMKAII